MSIEIRKKEKLLQLEQWANLSTHLSKRLNSFCYDDDDDEDYTIAVTPSLSIEEPDNSLNQFEDFFDSNKEFSSTDEDSFSIDNIDYVEASPPDSELVSSEVMEIVILEVDAFIAVEDEPTSSQFPQSYLDPEGDILLLEAFLNDDHTSDCKTKSSSTSLNSLLKETNTSDNSLPEFKTFCFDVEEISSGSTTTHSDISLPEYEVFYDDHVKEVSSGSPTTHSISPLYESFIFDLSINLFPPFDRSDFMSSLMNSYTSYLHQSIIVSFSRLNPTRGILPWTWWRIFLQQKNQEFIMLCPPIPPFN
nr:hypothetical protein [Tanacetum cinerariifolium]